jgi:hypothetical protein
MSKYNLLYDKYDETTEKPMLLNPETSEYLLVTDIREEVKRITASIPSDLESEKAFWEHKNLIKASADVKDPPIPSGVGYGAYYFSAFQQNFINGVAIAYNVVCPQKPGGNVTDWLYLTAKNRAIRSVEAYISYQAQNNFEFKVFD